MHGFFVTCLRNLLLIKTHAQRYADLRRTRRRAARQGVNRDYTVLDGCWHHYAGPSGACCIENVARGDGSGILQHNIPAVFGTFSYTMIFELTSHSRCGLPISKQTLMDAHRSRCPFDNAWLVEPKEMIPKKSAILVGSSPTAVMTSIRRILAMEPGSRQPSGHSPYLLLVSACNASPGRPGQQSRRRRSAPYIRRR